GWWTRWTRRRSVQSPVATRLGISSTAPVAVPVVAPRFDAAVRIRQFVATAGAAFRSLATSWAGLGFLVVVPLLTIAILLDQMYATGAPLTPTTGQVLKELTAPLASELSRWVIVPMLSIFFAGELVWREREAGVDEIGDAVPVPEWV